MMIGSVRDLHALLPVIICPPEKPNITIEFVIDTGFTGLMTLPSEIVSSLKLPYMNRISAQLADASFVDIPYYSANIIWNDEEKEVRVLATGERPLLGTSLLDANALWAEFQEEGKVIINEI